MTGEEIKALAELHTEDLPIEDSQVLAFINECIFMDLGKDAGVISSEAVSAAKDSWLNIQTSFLSIFEIEKEGQASPYYGRKYGKVYSGSFDIKDKMIRFPEDGTFTLWGYSLPAVYTDLTKEPAAHQLLHYPIAIYVASRVIFWDEEDNPSAELKMRDYQIYKRNVLNQIADMSPTTKKTRAIQIPPFI